MLHVKSGCGCISKPYSCSAPRQAPCKAYFSRASVFSIPRWRKSFSSVHTLRSLVVAFSQRWVTWRQIYRSKTLLNSLQSTSIESFWFHYFWNTSVLIHTNACTQCAHSLFSVIWQDEPNQLPISDSLGAIRRSCHGECNPGYMTRKLRKFLFIYTGSVTVFSLRALSTASFNTLWSSCFAVRVFFPGTLASRRKWFHLTSSSAINGPYTCLQIPRSYTTGARQCSDCQILRLLVRLLSFSMPPPVIPP